MSDGRKCHSCGRSIEGMHFNVRYCHRKECRKLKVRKSQQSQKLEPPKCCSEVYSVPVSLSSAPRGHAGTNYNPADQEEARKSALDWLLKGRKPEPMNVRRVVMVDQPRCVRAIMNDSVKAARRKKGLRTA